MHDDMIFAHQHVLVVASIKCGGKIVGFEEGLHGVLLELLILEEAVLEYEVEFQMACHPDDVTLVHALLRLVVLQI
jgi:hypothetical protein